MEWVGVGAAPGQQQLPLPLPGPRHCPIVACPPLLSAQNEHKEVVVEDFLGATEAKRILQEALVRLVIFK